jgi:hypothetical protein
MGPRDPDVRERRARDGEQAVAHAHDGLGHDTDALMVPQEVVHVSDRARVRVLDRDDRGVDLGVLERREDLRERAAWQELLTREQRRGRGLRKGTSESLIRDAQRWTAVRHSA